MHLYSLTLVRCANPDQELTFQIGFLSSYVDSKLWDKTRRLFPDEVAKRLQGESVDIPDKELDFSYVQSRQHYGQGELRKEYELEVSLDHVSSGSEMFLSVMSFLLDHFRSLIQRQRQEAELERRRQQEEAASSDLLSTLQREEEEARKAVEEKRRQEEEDAKLAGNTVAIDAQAELIRPCSERKL